MENGDMATTHQRSADRPAPGMARAVHPPPRCERLMLFEHLPHVQQQKLGLLGRLM